MTEVGELASGADLRDGSLDSAARMPSATGAASPDVDAARPRRRWWWVAAFVGLAAVTAGAWLVGRGVRSPGQAASEAAAPVPSWITARVEQRVLSQTVITRGDVRPEVSAGVGAPSSIEGSSVVTAIGSTPGGEVVEGTRLLEVSGRPVFVLQGGVPVYRSLRPLMEGTDVAQLQAALTRFGCDTSPDGAVFGAATKTCVAKLYTDAGYDPVPTSTTDEAELTAARQAVADAQAGVESAQVTFDKAGVGPSGNDVLAADMAVRSAQRGYHDAVASKNASVAQAQGQLARAQERLEQVYASAESTPAEVSEAEGAVHDAVAAVDAAVRSGDSAIASAGDGLTLAKNARAALDVAPDVSAEFVALGQAMQARDAAQARLVELESATGPTVAQGEVVFVPSLPARVQQIVTVLGPVSGGQTGSGDGSGGSGDLATLAAGDLVVAMTVRSGDRGLVRVGMAVELLDEQSNTTYPATISSIADTAATGQDGQLGFAAVITPTVALPAELSGVNLRVTITAASTETATLVVPVVAVSSAADGSTNVSIIPAGAADPVVVPVTTGLSADGFVAIEPVTPGALGEGDQVVVGR